ncbi:MAG TPA: CAP domain-containing protein [Pseudogracilibacillus sp.]|nr:CAP domain-containing protein [Pseudogracilibacillus sp.]
MFKRIHIALILAVMLVFGGGISAYANDDKTSKANQAWFSDCFNKILGSIDTEDESNDEREQLEEKEKGENVKNDEASESDQLDAFEREVVELTNEEREKHDLSPLQIDQDLSNVARKKSKDMAKEGYFDHESPTYGSPFDMIKSYDIDYYAAGENIAKGQQTPQEVVDAWMDSPGHRENILNDDFTHIGVGFVEDGSHWTQMFISK